jgi:hypothetical protein
MTFRQTTLERAFELARSGDYLHLADITKQLRAEGYAVNQLEGGSLRKQLRLICTEAQARP